MSWGAFRRPCICRYVCIRAQPLHYRGAIFYRGTLNGYYPLKAWETMEGICSDKCGDWSICDCWGILWCYHVINFLSQKHQSETFGKHPLGKANEHYLVSMLMSTPANEDRTKNEEKKNGGQNNVSLNNCMFFTLWIKAVAAELLFFFCDT